MEKKENFCEDEITCPNCGCVFTDSWERQGDEGEEECECGCKFNWNRDVSVSYSAEEK